MDPDTVRALQDALAAELPAAIALRRRLHADPEPSGSETRTAAAVVEAIGAGQTAIRSETVAGTGRLVRVGPDGPCVAVRAELDALPLTELTGEAGAATNGHMHACGHDVHLAAVVALARAARTVGWPLLAVLQPREESPPSGARDIAEAKVLEAHQVRAVVGAHLQPLLAPRTVAATPGAVNAATDQFEIVVTGRGGHGGYPHLTRDPVLALAQVIVGLQQLVSRRIDPMHAAVVTVGSLRAGSAPNVIPDRARAHGTLRVLEESDQELARRELAATVEGIAAAYGCRGEVLLHEGEPALVNDLALTERSHAWLDELGFELAPPLRSCGADDFAFYGATAPSLMMFVGTHAPGAMLHQPTFHPGDEAVGDVAHALLAGCLAAQECPEPGTGQP